jgi:hypothetical protein
LSDRANIPRWRGLLDDRPMPDGPWIGDVHSFDIPNTIRMCILNAGPGCVGIVLVDRGGPEMREAVEQAARERGVVILWEDRVAAAEVPEPGETP